MSIETLKREITQLEARLSDQQFTFPLDIQSKRVRQMDTLVLQKEALQDPFLVSDIIGLGLGVIYHKNQERFIWALRGRLSHFTADAGTDTLSSTHPVTNGEQLTLVSTGILPDPLALNTYYYVINSTGTTFQLSSTEGGVAIDLIDIGAGNHYLVQRP